jgi:hypothetical protein
VDQRRLQRHLRRAQSDPRHPPPRQGMIIVIDINVAVGLMVRSFHFRKSLMECFVSFLFLDC